MRLAIIADIHSNLEALQAVVSSCKSKDIQEFLCVGDIVGYGTNPNECIEIIKDLKAESICGNHEWAVLEKCDIKYFNKTAQHAVIWTRRNISSEGLEYLDNLDLIFKNEDLILVHGSLNTPDEFYYLTDKLDAFDTFSLMDRNVCFIGHTHKPQIFDYKENSINVSSVQNLNIDKEHKYIINVGSVGQPRDGIPDASYCIYDTDLNEIEIIRESYDVKKAQKKILDAGLPAILAYRLSFGK